jgi:cell division septation protein DedD
MRIVSTLVLAAVPLSTIAAVGAAGAQASDDDSARFRAVRQAGTPSTMASDSLFRRAERLVRDGRGEAGRALVDTLLARTRPGSLQHGQALYWRASLAADAAEAERGYRRVILEYPATRWSGDALLNLAQLEMARGDQEGAFVHLYRFEREYPSHESRGRASFWLARLHFDRKNERRACASLATARVAAPPDDVELRNQIDYHGQRCIGVDTTVATSAPPTVAATTAVNTPAVTAARPPVTISATRSAGATAAGSVAESTAVPTVSVTNAPTLPAPRTASTPSRGAGQDSQHVTSAPVPVPASDSSGPRGQLSVGGYTVQVAAYSSRPAAEALIAKLKARGYTARLASSSRPFRVRIGRYDTRADALAAQQRLKAKGIDGFVTEVEK